MLSETVATLPVDDVITTPQANHHHSLQRRHIHSGSNTLSNIATAGIAGFCRITRLSHHETYEQPS
jgi:hypothetical protein